MPYYGIQKQIRANRKAAKESGSKFYDGSPCKKCGSTERYTGSSDCRQCHIKKCTKRNKENPKYQENQRKWREANIISRKEYDKRWYQENKEKSYEYTLKKKYGITYAEYEKMLTEQKGLCAICGKTEPTENRRLAVDHCHRTGKVRSLLCGKCNKAIGLLDDDPELMKKAIEYMRKHID